MRKSKHLISHPFQKCTKIIPLPKYVFTPVCCSYFVDALDGSSSRLKQLLLIYVCFLAYLIIVLRLKPRMNKSMPPTSYDRKCSIMFITLLSSSFSNTQPAKAVIILAWASDYNLLKYATPCASCVPKNTYFEDKHECKLIWLRYNASPQKSIFTRNESKIQL